VHLTDGGQTLVICEGIETGLSILQATGLYIWVALGTTNLGQLKLPSFTREIIIAADNDGPGTKAACDAAELYLQRGVSVSIAKPRCAGSDFNDLVTLRGIHGGRG
jgi:phage/plasmid primase-like uncharacterized protein